MTAPLMSLNTIATRYEGADCIKYGSPADWDINGRGSHWQSEKLRMPREVLELMAVAMCAECPLLSMCARDSLAERPVGVIRAGIAVTGGHGAMPWQRAVWRAVGAGGDLTRAVYGLSPNWDVEKAQAWIDERRPWTRGALRTLPRRARLEGARPERAGGPRGRAGARRPRAGVAG